jgi:formylglycine-generating enzyme required for sulfatase activity
MNKNIFRLNKILAAVILVPLLWACGSGSNGQLTGVLGRIPWFQPDPYGMLYLPMGSFTQGLNDQDIPFAQTSSPKTVSVPAFYMDETEITNNEYRQFVEWVRDSLARRILSEEFEEDFLITIDGYGNEIEEYADGELPALNWDTRFRYNNADYREALNQMYYEPNQRLYGRKEFDVRKFEYEAIWIDFKEAAAKANREAGNTDRSIFIKKDKINIFPDTLAWVHDFTYSFNEPMTNQYFWHPAYDEYPVVGITWRQARAFSIWRTRYMNQFLSSVGDVYVQDFRLPSETEWEYASRGGLDLNPYPWGGPYTRNTRGCFLANFKPLRGNYTDDGGIYTVNAYSYAPNDYGLYCMSGNVAEWTSNAFDESAFNFTHDLSTDYKYEANESDPPVLKRKVIRGGSWKDVGFYLQTSARTYEFQDTAKCYIGFRCVMSYLGRAKNDLIR